MRLSIIIPAYNESGTIKQVLDRVADADVLDWEKEIIIVDDGSTDNSKVKMQNAKSQFKIQNLNIIRHEKNLGKGAAIRTALNYATGDYAIIQDADLEYDPAEYKILLEALEPKAGAIFGSRELSPQRRGYKHYVLGVKILTGFANLLFGSNLTDIYTCYKLISLPLLKSLNLESNGFEIEAEITTKLLRRGIKIKEAPINYSPRRFAEGKKIRALDGFEGIWTILKYKFLN